MANVSLEVIFCDDVRREADGRFSLMGVFGGIRVFREQEQIAKVAACIFLRAPVGHRISDVKVSLAVIRGSEVEHEEFLPELPEIASNPPHLAELARRVNATELDDAVYAGVLELQNLPVGDGLRLQVRGAQGDEEISGASVFLAPDSAQSSDDVVVKQFDSKIVQRSTKTQSRRKPKKPAS